MRRALAALAALAGLAAVMPVAPSPARAQGQAPPTTAAPAPPASRLAPRLSLAFQTPYVSPGSDFMLRLRVERTVPATAELSVTVFRAVQTRSEFEQTLDDHIARPIAIAMPPVAIGSLAPDAAGEVTVRVPVDLGPVDGVFPVRVELRERGAAAPLERFVTHLVHFSGNLSGPELALAVVLPVRAPVSLPPDSPRSIGALDELAASIAAMDAARGLPYALAPSPETVAALAASTDDRAERAIETLRRLATDHPVVAGPYVPVSVQALLGADLAEEVDAQLATGRSVLSEILRVQADGRTWIETEPLDPEAIDGLVQRGVERIVAAEPVLEPVPDLNVTISRPFVLAGREEDVPALSADPGLSAHFNDHPRQALQANHLLADLAVLWLDAPAAERRTVVAMAPAGWRANRAFLDTLLNGLAQSPVVEAVGLDTAFTGVSPALNSRGLGLVRRATPAPPNPVADVAAGLRQARRRLTSLGTVVSAANEPVRARTVLEERLLVAQSSEVASVRARQAYIDAVEEGIADNLDAIDMPEGRSITLTARRGQIPVTFQNRTGTPVRVLVTMGSDKLEFPQGPTKEVELSRRNTTERFEVVALTSGAFPLRITLQSPDGELLIGQARLTVRSTAASRVSVAVSVGAVAFLALWWGRHVVRGRRARRLVPV